MRGSLLDFAPILLAIAVLQLVVLQLPVPNLADRLVGVFLVVLGLTFFVFGLELGLFSICESMAHAFVRKGAFFGSWHWLFPWVSVRPWLGLR